MIINFIGFGEAAQAFCGMKTPLGTPPKRGFDIKTNDEATRTTKQADFERYGVECALTAQQALNGDIIMSLVPADQSLKAAQSVAPYLPKNCLYFDMNSTAPATKLAVCELITNAGARYVDTAIMAPVYPAKLNVPILLAGPHATAAKTALDGLGFAKTRCVGDEVGRASSIKMIRSVMIKGIEALTAECALAANQAGVLEEVFGSMGKEWLDDDGQGRANYNFDRMMIHGRRRAAEMVEVCKTLSDLGIEPKLSQGTVARQQSIGELGYLTPAQTLQTKLDQVTNTLPPEMPNSPLNSAAK